MSTKQIQINGYKPPTANPFTATSGTYQAPGNNFSGTAPAMPNSTGNNPSGFTPRLNPVATGSAKNPVTGGPATIPTYGAPATPVVVPPPPTVPVAPAENQLIVTGSKPAKKFAENQQQMNQAINQSNPVVPTPTTPTTPTQSDGSKVESPYAGMESYSDPYTQALDKIAATSDKATQNLIATIKAAKANRESTINTEYDRLKSGLMSLGLSTGNINFTPDLVYGNIMQAENARASKLQQLDRDEATALLEAQQAAEDKDFTVLKEKMDYYKSIKKSRLDLLKESFDTMNYEEKISEIQANRIYDDLQKKTSDKAKLDYLMNLSSTLGIPLNSLQSQVNNITRDRAAKSAASSTASVKKLGKPGFTGETISFPNTQETLDSVEELGLNEEVLKSVGNLLRDGYSLKQIVQAGLIDPDQYAWLAQYVSKPKAGADDSDEGEWGE